MAIIAVGMQCFWGAEAIFGSKLGIITTKVGYAGGSTKNPTYRNIGDHIETVFMEFDGKKITFEEILDLFLKSHDPTIRYKRQYMSAIFYQNDDEKARIETLLKSRQENYSKPIATEMIKFNDFTNAENYHHKYFLRKFPSLMDNFAFNDDSLISSPLAAKLNGLCAGFGSLEIIDKASLEKLTEENKNILQKLVKNGPNLAECGL